MLELDFSERTEDKEQEYSREDMKFLKIVSQRIRHTEDRNYEIPFLSALTANGFLIIEKKTFKELRVNKEAY